jgi:plastocyanin
MCTIFRPNFLILILNTDFKPNYSAIQDDMKLFLSSESSIFSRSLCIKSSAVIFSCFVFMAWASAQEVVLKLHNSDGEPIVGAVMELLSSKPLGSSARAIENVAIDQRDKEFIPTVTTLVVGTSVGFPNSDDILHHVYSFSAAKTFDTPLYGSDVSNEYPEVFDVPGVIEIGCNIHDWMLAYIYVGESALMAISDEQGLASLTDLPAGEYTLKVWHSRLDAEKNSIQQSIVVEQGGSLELALTLDLVRDRRVRRAPSANRKRYR